MFEVIYYSMTGNTKKVAEAIAAELDVSAEDVRTKGRLAKDSFLFLGSGRYFPLPGNYFGLYFTSFFVVPPCGPQSFFSSRANFLAFSRSLLSGYFRLIKKRMWPLQ